MESYLVTIESDPDQTFAKMFEKDMCTATLLLIFLEKNIKAKPIWW